MIEKRNKERKKIEFAAFEKFFVDMQSLVRSSGRSNLIIKSSIQNLIEECFEKIEGEGK